MKRFIHVMASIERQQKKKLFLLVKQSQANLSMEILKLIGEFLLYNDRASKFTFPTTKQENVDLDISFMYNN